MKLVSVIFCLTLGLFVFQASGAFELVASAACEQGCADDDAQGRCADSCTDCACCFHARPIAPAAVPLPAIPVGVARAPHAVPAAAASAPAGEILHVPIAVG